MKLNVLEYFDDFILGGYEELEIKHPNNEIWLSNQIRLLCRKSSSTQLIPLLVNLSAVTRDDLTRAMLAKEMYQLRVGYLESFKEYSDRALILLAERENEFDRWEGIYILGCFGKDGALKYLQTRLSTEANQLLAQTINRAIEKIEINKEKRKRERGFS